MNKITNFNREETHHYKLDTARVERQKISSSDFQFYISRYPFPHCSLNNQNKCYKTFYQCHELQLAQQKISRLASLNKLSSLIKLRKIVKNIFKPNISKDEPNISVQSYSLYYQIVHHFILSVLGISIIKSMNHRNDYRKLFHGVMQAIESLISQKIYYLLDVQNIGLTIGGHVKIYVPANIIIEQTIFTEWHEHEMRNMANTVIQCLIRSIQNFSYQTQNIDVQNVKHQIKREIQKLQIKSKNIESQIFTFNQNTQSLADKAQNNIQKNQDLQKTVKIRKCSQNLQLLPPIDLNLMKINRNLLTSRQNHKRCITSRDFVDHMYNQLDDIKQIGQVIYQNHPKENQILKEKMKQYEDKLNSLGNTVRQMKQQLMGMSKKEKRQKNSRSPQQKQSKHQRERSHTLTYINESSEDISLMVQKLSMSRLQIKKLLNNQNDLRHSYHVDEQIQQKQKSKNKKQNRPQKINNKNNAFDFERQFQAIIASQNQQEQIKQNHEKHSNRKNTKIFSDQRNEKQINNMKQTLKLTDRKDKIRQKSKQKSSRNKKQHSQKTKNNENSSGNKIRKSFQSYDYQSSLGKQSPPGGNPFRQYGNFRIQYVIDQQNKQDERDNHHVGYIEVHPQSIKQPYRIVKAPIQKQHILYPLVRLKQPFRYSCLAIPHEPNGQFQYIAIPQNLYDPTEYDSIDTFQMELGRQYTMPRIVSKGAFRHTLFPSTIVGRLRSPPKKSQKGEDSLQGSVKNKNNRVHESAGKSNYIEIVQPVIIKQRQSGLSQNSSQRKANKKLPRVPQLIINQAPQVCQQVQGEGQSPYKINIKSPQNKIKRQIKQISKSLQKHRINFMNQSAKRQTRQKSQNTISKTSKDVSKLLRNNIKQQDKHLFQNTKKTEQNNVDRKQKMNKQKLNDILNKSKQIISKYRKLNLKKQ